MYHEFPFTIKDLRKPLILADKRRSDFKEWERVSGFEESTLS